MLVILPEVALTPTELKPITHPEVAPQQLQLLLEEEGGKISPIYIIRSSSTSPTTPLFVKLLDFIHHFDN